MSASFLTHACLPSFWWLWTGLHLMVHLLYHALHPNRQLLIGLIILHLLRLLHEVPWFVSLGFAILIGRTKSLLRSHAEEPSAMGPDALERCHGVWYWKAWFLGAWFHRAWYWGARCLGSLCWARGLVPKFACLGTSFLTFDFWALRREHWGRTYPLRPQWWHIGGCLMVGSF
jgi:hypothetical protein